MIACLAVPVQSQTPVPTVPLFLTNPTTADLVPCGLPPYAEFNASATVTTFNMTADCTINAWDIQTNYMYLFFTAGTFTINGNGYSISGPPNGWTIYVQNAGTVLNLNNVTIRQSRDGITVDNGRLNANNVIFRDNNSNVIVAASNAGQIYLENVQFLSNTGTGIYPAIIADTGLGSLIRITNGHFQGNTGFAYLIEQTYTDGTIQLEGCITYVNNHISGMRYNTYGTVTDNSNPAACLALTPQPKPKKKEEAPTAVPTSTPRPQIAATHAALQAATGATFRTAFGLDSGVHFRQLDGAGIGVQSIIDAGYLEAFDVYGYVEQGVEVCFPQIGRVIFLDARTMPRAIVPLDSTVVNGQTCVSINSPGSLVLLPN